MSASRVEAIDWTPSLVLVMRLMIGEIIDESMTWSRFLPFSTINDKQLLEFALCSMESSGMAIRRMKEIPGWSSMGSATFLRPISKGSGPSRMWKGQTSSSSELFCISFLRRIHAHLASLNLCSLSTHTSEPLTSRSYFQFIECNTLSKTNYKKRCSILCDDHRLSSIQLQDMHISVHLCALWYRTHRAPGNQEFVYPKQLFLDFIEEYDGTPFKLLSLEESSIKRTQKTMIASLFLSYAEILLTPVRSWNPSGLQHSLSQHQSSGISSHASFVLLEPSYTMI